MPRSQEWKCEDCGQVFRGITSLNEHWVEKHYVPKDVIRQVIISVQVEVSVRDTRCYNEDYLDKLARQAAEESVISKIKECIPDVLKVSVDRVPKCWSKSFVPTITNREELR